MDENTGPRAVIFYDDKKLHQGFIVAGKEIEFEIGSCKTSNLIAGLIACYYTYHLNFPNAYFNALSFLCFRIFKIEYKSTIVDKYIRALHNFKKSKIFEANREIGEETGEDVKLSLH